MWSVTLIIPCPRAPVPSLQIIQDLLTNSKSPVVQLRDDPENDGAVYLPGCTTVPVSSAGECLKYYLQGDKRRTTGETLMNYCSSRSHTVCLPLGPGGVPFVGETSRDCPTNKHRH